MQKHFAVVTGIGMLAVAGIVVSQQSGFFQDSLKGSLTPGGGYPYMSTGYTPAFSESAPMSAFSESAPMSLASAMSQPSTPCGGSRGMCGGTCGTPGWTCQWNPRASNGSCVCTDPDFCDSVATCGTAVGHAGDPRCGTTVDCCNAGIRSTTVVQCSSAPSSTGPCSGQGTAPGPAGCCEGYAPVDGGCWAPCTGPNMGPGCATASSASSTITDSCGGVCESVGRCCDGAGECISCGSSAQSSEGGGCAYCPNACSGMPGETGCCNLGTNSCQ